MKLVLEGSYARLSKPPLAVFEFLDSYMTLEYSGFFKTKNMKRAKFRRELVHLYDEGKQRFPAGLIYGVSNLIEDELAENLRYYEWAAAHAEGDEQTEAQEMLQLASIELDDRTPHLTFSPHEIAKKAPWLLFNDGDRDYTFQYDAVMTALHQGRGIIKAPTGAGKTNIAAGVMAVVPSVDWLFVAPSIDLVVQAKKRYEKLTGEEGGQIGDGKWDIRRCTFATFQTLNKRIQQRDPEAMALRLIIKGLIVDECHTLPANTFFPTAMFFNKAHVRLGISATPLDRGDRRSVFAVAALGPVCWSISTADLVERGVLSKAHVRMLEVHQVPAMAKTWRGEYGKNVVRSSKRNTAILRLASSCKKPALLFVNQVDHGKAILQKLVRSGITAELVWGDKSVGERQAALKRLDLRVNDVLVSSPVFNQGIDAPEIRTIINAAAGQSVINTLQRMGRGSRRAVGKADYDLWDIYDYDDHTLEKWSRARKRAYEREGHDVELVTP